MRLFLFQLAVAPFVFTAIYVEPWLGLVVVAANVLGWIEGRSDPL